MLGAMSRQSVLYAFVPFGNCLNVDRDPCSTPGANRLPSPVTVDPGTNPLPVPVIPKMSPKVAIE